MSEWLLEARDVSKSFGVVQAVSRVTLGIRAGEVHAVVGENGAGKSTLMSLFCGRLAPTSGALHRRGAPVAFRSPLDAQRAGVAIAPQEVNLVPALTVAENVLLGAQPLGRLRAIDWARTRAQAAAHVREIDPGIPLDAPVQALSKPQQQLVQIARAAATSAEVLIFDEPTAALTYRESGRLFDFIRAFRARGGAVFYISHRLDEVLALSDRISVMRDGELVAELAPGATSKDELVRHMAGRSVEGAASQRAARQTEAVVLRVRGLTRAGEFRDVSFDLHRGEILGVAGLIGSGRTELGKCLFGVTRPQAGTIEVEGRPARIRHPADAAALGLVYLPEERKQEGIFPVLSIAENMAQPSLGRFRGPLGLRSGALLREVAAQVARLRIKLGDPSDPITSLSGGNQQKVILARWLMAGSRILVLDEPTRGIDVHAKGEIQAHLRRLAGEGLSLVYISSELEEVLEISDRILVMHEGLVKGVADAREATQESLLRQAMS
ncbi:MAG: sugar ABC transporter ATP-binding protein [Anaeromyxobacter sp.]